MMNQTLKDIYARKSVRVFEEKEIGAEEKRRILKEAHNTESFKRKSSRSGSPHLNDSILPLSSR